MCWPSGRSRRHSAPFRTVSEGAFSEVRRHGVLRSSARGCGTPQRKEGDVVLLLPALSNEGVELLQEQVPKRSLLTVLGDERTKLRKAEHSPLGVMGFHQPVAVEQHAPTLSERGLSLLIAHPCHKPKRHPPGP